MLTYILIFITVATSIAAFNSPELKKNMLFYPYAIKRLGEYYRFVSSGLIHADWMHLLVNMIVLYFFGTQVEYFYEGIFGRWSSLVFIALYFGGMVAADITSYLKHQEHSYYRSLGASGATSAILFAFILFDPLAPLLLFPIPFEIPAIIIGLGYLFYSHYAAKQAQDNINHEAHFYGAVFGIIFTIILHPKVVIDFAQQLLSIFGS